MIDQKIFYYFQFHKQSLQIHVFVNEYLDNIIHHFDNDLSMNIHMLYFNLILNNYHNVQEYINTYKYHHKNIRDQDDFEIINDNI
jgi:hypothetical protein